ncbi:MAG: hypothetical protein QOF46_3381 [Paraburkholderia sp.]|nr:hypothetical protein [Paraburkholderia sp.]
MVARGLGWFSILLGVAQVLAPRVMSRAVGVKASPATMRMTGLRELTCGVGILAARDPRPFLWARVGGDALDLGTLATASSGLDAHRRRAMISAVNVACLSALDVYAANRSSAAAPADATRRAIRDYSARSGFPRQPSAMRGAALADFETPRDMRTPEALQSFTRKTSPAADRRKRAGSVTSQD